MPSSDDNDLTGKPDECIFEELDTSVFDSTSEVVNNPVTPVANKKANDKPSPDKPAPPRKTTKLRKFKGHREPAADEEKKDESKMSLDERVAYFKERLKKGITEEQIALEIAAKEASKEEEEEKPETEHKVYSPYRSFVDLLHESESRKLMQSRSDPEATWRDASREDDHTKGKGINVKMVILSGITVLAMVAAGIIFYNHHMDTTTDVAEISQELGNANGLTPASQVDKDKLELANKVTKILQEFHDSTDLNHQASMCRMPNRTLADMKKFSSGDETNFDVIDVQLSTTSVKRSDITFTLAKVKLEQGGVEDIRYAYFSEDAAGNLKLDWHSYVGFEASAWRAYLLSKDKTPVERHLTVQFNGDLHPDYSEEKFIAINVRSWLPNMVDSTNAIVSKEDPMYEKFVAAFQSGQRTFILKVHHLGDIANSLIVDEIISTSEFYVSDINAE